MNWGLRMKNFVIGICLSFILNNSYAMQERVAQLKNDTVSPVSILVGADSELKASKSESRIVFDVQNPLLADSNADDSWMRRSQSESCVHDDSLAEWMKDPLYEISHLTISAKNIIHFIAANSPRLTRRNICYENVLIYTIYSYACLTALKYCLCGSYQDDSLKDYDVILDQFEKCRRSAKNEWCLYGAQCRQKIPLFLSRDYLFPSDLNLKAYSRSMQNVICDWESRILSELRVYGGSKSTVALKKSVQLFEKIRAETKE